MLSTISVKPLQLAKFLVDANFYISVLVLVYGCLTAVSSLAIFDFNEDLYGALHNNLRMALLYMGFTEIVVCVYCFATNQPRLMLAAGYFLIMMMGSLAFYGKINSIQIDDNMPLFFLYTGASHILYGFLSGIGDSKPTEHS